MRDLYVSHLRTPFVSCRAVPPAGRLHDNSWMIPQDPSDISRMRISDADRDRAAAILGDALAEGRLTPEEHSERLDTILAAKTQAEIVPVVADLPGATARLGQPSNTLARTGAGPLALPGRPARMVAILSGISRKGAWRAPEHIQAVTVLGGTELDFRQATLTARETRVRAFCLLGGVEITVPPEMHVVDNSVALLGGIEIPPDSAESASPDAPVLRISGINLLGGLTVRRKGREGASG